MVTMEESIPQYSAGYKQARSSFYFQFNDVDFYIEDAWQENLYHCILSKLFPTLRIENIHSLCGKENALAHAKTRIVGRKSVYLLDKDFDDLHGKIHQQENIFYLEKYCMENFLIEEQALVMFVISEKPRLKQGDIRKELGFATLWDEMVKQLSKLFAVFFIVQKHNLPMQSTSHAPSAFCSKDDKCNINGERIAIYIKEALKHMTKQNVQRHLDAELEDCATDFELKKAKQLRGTHVSGEYLLLLFSNRLAKQFGLNSVPDMHSFAYRLAEKCEFQSLARVRLKISAYLKAK